MSKRGGGCSHSQDPHQKFNSTTQQIYPLVMTNTLPWEMALIEIDGKHRSENSMVMASMANCECHNQMGASLSTVDLEGIGSSGLGVTV